MPFSRSSAKHRRYPYGPGADFAIGSGERLAAKRREAAQLKASLRRYPGMLPQAMGAMGGGMFGNGQSTGHMHGLGGLGQAMDFDGFERDNWETPTAFPQPPFLRRQYRSPFSFASQFGPGFGRPQESFWPGRASQEGIPWGQGAPGMMGEDLLDELYARRQPGDDYFDGHSGFGPGHFAHPFQQYPGGRCHHHQNEPLRNNHCYGSGDAGYGFPTHGRFDDQPGHGGGYGPFPYRAQSHPWRGSPRDSYERLRPEDL